MRDLLVGIGKALRGDDAVGLVFLERYPERAGLERFCVGDDPLSLLEVMTEVRRAVLVDAVKSGSPAGTIHRFDLSQPPVSQSVRFSTHTLDPLQVLELGRRLGRSLPEQCTLFGVEIQDVTLGRGLSAEVERALPELTRLVDQEFSLCV